MKQTLQPSISLKTLHRNNRGNHRQTPFQMRPHFRNLVRFRPFSHNPTSIPHYPTSKITSFHQIHPFYSTLPTNSSIVLPKPSVSWPDRMHLLVGLFSEQHDFSPSSDAREKLVHKVSILKDELLKCRDDFHSVRKILNDVGSSLLSSYFDGSAMVELLNQIHHFPQLAIEVFNWRRQQASFCFPITSEEYAKAIKVAGHAKDVDLAAELFTEAVNNRCKTSSTYNSLMNAYMVNGLVGKCQSLFGEFKKEKSCSPNLVTYNILISVFGRLMLIDHMEATLQEVYDSGLVPSVYTFNNLIAGYVTAWMWNRMENTYMIMTETPLKPDDTTYKLMVRGYSHAGNLEKMGEMYELLKQHLNEDDIPTIKTMICAYCKSSCENKIEKIDELLKLVPESEYRSWFAVTLIEMYAKDDMLDRMEDIIDVALKNNVIVASLTAMRSIAAAYFRHNAIDKLSSFVKRAERAGWTRCRSLYHAKMVLYSYDRRLEDMENVFKEMEKLSINRTKKSLAILSTAYLNWGLKCKFEQVVALMFKLGYDIHWEKLREI